MLRKNAVVTAAAVVSLSLALGACVAAFSLVDALILRPLPVRQPEQLVYLTFPTDAPERSGGRDVQRSAVRRAARRRARACRPVRDEHAGHAAGDVRRPVEREGAAAHAVRVRRRLRPARRDAGGRTPADRPGRPAAWRASGGGRQPRVLAASLRRRSGDRRPLVHARGPASSRSSASPTPRFAGVEPGRPTDVWMPYAMYNPRAFGNFSSTGSACSAG